jgi:hypothetical protein
MAPTSAPPASSAGAVAVPGAGRTVTQVLQHAVADQLAWAAILGVGAGPSADIEPALTTAHAAWAAVQSDDDAVLTPLPQGKMPPKTAAAACALDAAVHAWDIAMGGLPLPNGLAADLSPTAHEIVEPLRQFGVYVVALPPEPGDDSASEWLRFLGRDPSWKPAR